MAKESIWKEHQPLSQRQQLELRAKTVEELSRRCKHKDNGRCYAPFAESRASRCRGSIGCENFEIIW